VPTGARLGDCDEFISRGQGSVKGGETWEGRTSNMLAKQ